VTSQITEIPNVDPGGPDDGWWGSVIAEDKQQPSAGGAPGATAGRLEQLRARMLTSDQLDAEPAPVPLIAGHLYRDTISELWGKPGCGKSFLAMDWALCIASGKAWQGHAVTQGPVLYIVGEGLAGIGKRRRAWEAAWGHRDNGAMTWLRGAVPLMEIGWVDALAEAVADRQPVLVVIDTLSRSIAGHNENAPETMSAVVRNADRIREAAGGAAVQFVHHATKDGNTNRGHSALEGACEVRWKLVKDDGGLVLSNPKSKDDAEAPDRNLRLRRWELGESDTFGDPVTSAIVESHRPIAGHDETTASEAQLVAVVRDNFGTTGATPTALKETSGLSKSTYYRALNGLLGRGSLTNAGTDKRPLYFLDSPPGGTP